MKARWAAVLAILVGTAAEARTTRYAIAIGNNAPPALSGGRLRVLHFADDDAVRIHQFFGRFADEARLLSILDEQTQRRYPQVVSAAQPPTLEALASLVSHFAARVRADVVRGDQPVIYVSFSGHGGRLSDGSAFLALADGELTRARLQQEVLRPLSDAVVHLFVDACNAEGVVGVRGLFEREVDGETAEVTGSEASRLAGAAGLGFPRVGTLVATTAGQESYEWSQIESGVLTHELLSGLAGAADANGDGMVDYAEIQAFLSSANRDVEDARARPQVVAHAPAVDARLPIVSLAPMRDVAFLVGDFSPLKHFHIEMENGERHLDAHLSSELPGRIAFPANRRAFLVAGDRVALLFARAGEICRLEALQFGPYSCTARGLDEASLRDALFASAYGTTYQKGFEDGQRVPPLAAPAIAAQAAPAGSPSYRKPLAVAGWSIAGLSLAASATTAVLALKARGDYDAATRDRAAATADRFYRYRTATVVAGATAVAAGVAGFLLWPGAQKRVVATPVLLPRGAGVAVLIGGEEGTP